VLHRLCVKRLFHLSGQADEFFVVILCAHIVKQQVLRTENILHQGFQLVLQILSAAVKILLQIIHQAVKRHAVDLLLNGRRPGKIRHGSACGNGMSCGDQVGLQP